MNKKKLIQQIKTIGIVEPAASQKEIERLQRLLDNAKQSHKGRK